MDVSKPRWWDQLTNPPLESPLPLGQQVKTLGNGPPAHVCLNGFLNWPSLKLYKIIPENWWVEILLFLLGWPIFRSYVSFISRWFARFSFTANIQLGLPRCLTLMNWSSWVHPKFVGSKMSRGLVVFLEKVWVYCGKKQRFHSTVDVGASPQVLKMFLVNV